MQEEQCVHKTVAGAHEAVERVCDGADRGARKGSRVDEHDAAMIFLSVREAVHELDEIDHVKCDQDTTLARCLTEQIVVAQIL